MTAPTAQRLLHALEEATAKLEAVEREKHEPIAVIGLSCRFPGADSPEAYWEVLRDGRETLREVPPERWDLNAYYDPDPDAPGKMYVRLGGFLERLDEFDAAFFGISPREAQSMDPQQRLVLTVAWEALERAGQTPAQLSESATGVFIGATTTDYAQRLLLGEHLDMYFGSGNALNALAGRVAYTLGLQGPCFTVDSACSSSLTATHLACQSLRARECRLALAGGVNVTLSPEITAALCRARFFAADGRCKTFDEAADGYVRGEGCGVIVLKRLSDAIADGDLIWAVLRGSAVNQDGPSSGFTVPNGPAQQALIREALRRARVNPLEIQYVEAHGTGTALGDPIEVRALGAELCVNRPADQPLLIGSVKTNLGHLESAAGMAGLIKVILALRHNALPPHLNLKQPSSRIPWDEFALRVPTTLTAWPSGPRLAGVSSFGVSGTNAHVIVGEYLSPTVAPAAVERPLHLLTFSAKNETALRATAQAYAEALTKAALPDFSFTVNTRRAHWAQRAAIIAPDSAQAIATLHKFTAGTPLKRKKPKVAFLFTGQGAPQLGVGQTLYATQPIFRAAFDDCAARFAALGVDVVALLHAAPQEAALSQALAQPLLFALQYALAQLWQGWGLAPQWMMGHSAGEIAAACVAGALTLADGARLIAARGRLMSELPPNGLMLATSADEATVRAALVNEPRVAIAAYNAPGNLVLSGEREAVESIAAQLHAAGFRATPLNIAVASHSPLVEPLLSEFSRHAQTLTYHATRIKVISNLTGEIQTTFNADYWAQHTRQPVRFAQGFQTLLAAGAEVFIELGPKPTLLGLAQQNAPEAEALWLPSLNPPQAEWQTLLTSLSEFYTLGGSVNWDNFDQPYTRHLADVPTYPWQPQRYWRGTPATPNVPRVDRATALQQLGTEFTEAELPIVKRVLDRLFPAENAALPNWFYTLEWRPQPLALPSTPPNDRVWFIQTEDQAAREALSAQLVGLQQALTTDALAATDLVLWFAPSSIEDKIEAMRSSNSALLEIVHTLAKHGCTPRVWLITPTSDTPCESHLPLAGVWGFRRVLTLEHPEWRATILAVPNQSAVESAALLLPDLLHTGDEDEIAWRNGERYVSRLSPNLPQVKPIALAADGLYLITGGLSGLGWLVAGWLIQNGARQLALLGRRPPTPDVSAQLAAWRGQGIIVHTFQADVSNFTELKTAFTTLPTPVRGIIHAAGQLDDGIVLQQTWERFERVLAAKVAGAWNLHTLTDKTPLDFFVLFSSTTSFLGNAGQANHAAANAFLDALAHYRRGRDLPALSINWGAWAEVGAAARVNLDKQKWGVDLISPEMGLRALGAVLNSDLAQCAIVPLDAARLTQMVKSPRLRELAPAALTAVPEGNMLLAWQSELNPKKQRALLLEAVQAQAATVLGWDTPSALDMNLGFFDLGLDSLTAIEFRNKLQKRLGLALPATLAFDSPSVNAVVEFILRAHAPTPEAAPVEKTAPDLSALSEEELARKLDEELASL